LFVPHVCRCGSQVDAWGLHAMVCKHAPGRLMRHHALNDIIARAFTSAGMPAVKEPTGLSRSDGRRSDGLSLLPWQTGKPLSWDVTVAATLADSYISATSSSGGAAAEMEATRKMAKYVDLPASYLFQPVALETLGPINDSAVDFLSELGSRIGTASGEIRERQFLFQRLSVTIQRFNLILLHNSFVERDDPDL